MRCVSIRSRPSSSSRFHWVALPASIYAFGCMEEFSGRISVGVLGALLNGFLLSMTLVVLADNGFFFPILWEIMSLLSHLLVVTEHESLASARPDCSI